MISASQALERLCEGNRRFVADDCNGGQQAGKNRRRELAAGQEPFATILGCSDSRVPAEIIFDQGLGDLFVIRVAGNIIAPSLVGSVEFAAARFGTPLVVVLGHTQCGAIAAVLLVGALAVFFRRTATGRALRAVADDHQAAQSIGIPLNRIWVIVWSVAGVVAIVGGVIWGGKLGAQFSISQVALKALPVVILGGFESIPGAIVGGLIIGVGEKMAEVFLAPPLIKAFDLAGGGIENWFAYVLALLFLLVRPEGLFGERRIDRV